MTDLIMTHDAVSRLVQLIARRHGVALRWTGKGDEDVANLCSGFKNKEVLNQCLWNGLKELVAMESLKTLPEDIQAQIFGIVLKAQANFELDVKERDAKATINETYTTTRRG